MRSPRGCRPCSGDGTRAAGSDAAAEKNALAETRRQIEAEHDDRLEAKRKAAVVWFNEMLDEPTQARWIDQTAALPGNNRLSDEDIEAIAAVRAFNNDAVTAAKLPACGLARRQA